MDKVIKMICNLCPRECNIDRKQHTGFCGMGEQMKIARIAPHYDEEPMISGKNGTGAVFFSGCTLKCLYCQNYEISAEHKGRSLTPYELSKAFRSLEEMGVHSIELVTATHFLYPILEALSIYRPHLPIIYNSSGYEKQETLKLLEGIVDVYLPDFKYSDDELAFRLSGCRDYRDTALCAIKEMLRQTGELEIKDGLIKKGVIVRHLVLPNHTKNSIEALKLLKEHFGDRILVSLMSQYLPFGRANETEDLNRRITKREYEKVLDTLYALELDGFAQDLSSAQEKYIPDWETE